MKTQIRTRIFILITLLTLLLAPLQSALAQSYSFYVPEMRMQVYVQPDASVRIIYDITFENTNYGHAIDIVDIGTPHEDYDISNMKASVDGVSLSTIRTSTYIDTGVEVHLGSQAISQGETGTFHFEFTMPDLVYQDVTDRDYASLQITPTWFDESSVQGTTNLQIAIHMPEGVEPEEIRYQEEPFSQKAIFEGRTVALWSWPATKLRGPHMVGVSFPKRGMDQVVTMTIFQLTRKWLEDNPTARFLVVLISLALFSILYFRFSGGTGCALFVPLFAGLVALDVIAPLFSLASIPLLLILIVVNERHLRKKRKSYLPPIAQTEGGGIKRGLTAPEAATLLEMPLSKVLTLIIFGLLAKGIVKQVKADPLEVEVADDFRTHKGMSPTARSAHYRRVAQEKGTVIHRYEIPFLTLLQTNPGKPVKDIDFGGAMNKLVKETAEKIKNFDLSDTQDYYRRVVARAWEKAGSLGEVEQREEFLDKYLPWVLMSDRHPTVLTTRRYTYWPIWMRTSRPSISTSGGKAVTRGGSSRPSVGGRTSLGDVGASFAGWAENTMGAMAGAILPGSLQVPDAAGGVVDLSGVDRVTGDIFEALAKASASGSGGSSGGGSSCACACAGCACACACAGGGR